jgi:CheY-like chemotaxis protein/glycine cleavage system H lipoate-binding protein
METKQHLLVVDDEEIVCMSCAAIFGPKGFEVETVNDPIEGLQMARSRHYAAILLDIMMPEMTGIEFLEQLRTFDPTVPVIIITGYASISNAAEAMRLHASDYIPKPFTPDEISDAVSRAVRLPRGPEFTGLATLAGWTPDVERGYLFVDRSWRLGGRDGTVLAGAFFAREEGRGVERLRVPEVGDKLVEGLPMAEAILADGRQLVLPAPISGTVVEVNHALAAHPRDCNWNDPCPSAWIARVRGEASGPATLARPRRVVVANADPARGSAQVRHLRRLGCDVAVADTADATLAALAGTPTALVIVDGASMGEAAAGLITRIAENAPGTKVVVAAPSGWPHEDACRTRRVFYYAAEPFADDEIVDILDAAAGNAPVSVAKPAKAGSPLPDAVRVLRVTNRRGRTVALLAPNGVLREHDGVGGRVLQGVREIGLPAKITLGSEGLTTLDLWELAKGSDRGFVLLPQDSGRIPGTLLREAVQTPWTAEGEAEDKIISLLVQAAPGADPFGFDARTTSSLASFLLERLMSVG